MWFLNFHLKTTVPAEKDFRTEEYRGLKILHCSSITDIDRNVWDTINKDIFKSYNFLLAIEKSNIENCRLHYLLFFDKEKLAAAAVLSSFYISLDLIAGNFIQKSVLFIRRFYPSFFKIKFLFCGTPISIGKDNISISDDKYREEFIRLLSGEMSAIAKAEKIPFQSIKEFPQKRAAELGGFKKFNYIIVNTIPYMLLNIRWNNFNQYLQEMNYSYRRQINAGLHILKQEEPFIFAESCKPEKNKPYLLLNDTSAISSDLFYPLYMEVMQRTKNKLETLNKDFFTNFFELMKEHIEVLSFIDGEKILGSAIISNENDKMTFILVGFEHRDLEKYETYFNLVYGIIKLCIDRRCKLLEMGQTSYYFKQRCGAEPADSLFFIKSDNKLIHFILKISRNVIFPRLTLPSHSVFKGAKQV